MPPPGLSRHFSHLRGGLALSIGILALKGQIRIRHSTGRPSTLATLAANVARTAKLALYPDKGIDAIAVSQQRC
jgi:hypothetical protein